MTIVYIIIFKCYADDIHCDIQSACRHVFRYLLLLRVKVVVFCSDDLRVDKVGRATHNALHTGVLSDIWA